MLTILIRNNHTIQRTFTNRRELLLTVKRNNSNKMLLTIHNLPSTTRYADVKSLLGEKCGLTDIIVDNLVNEGNSKKVTVGLANEDDGAFVVRKLNGIFINGQQLYIEHKKRNTDAHDQPYRAPASFIQESRGFEQAHINNIVATAMAPNAAVAWDPNAIAPYMAHMPTEQNLAYAGYGVPQVAFVEPLPIPVENDRGYPGFQGNYTPVPSGPRPQAQGDWGIRGREPDAFQSSGPRTQAPRDRGSRGREPDAFHSSGPRPQAPRDRGSRGREPDAFHSSGPRPQAPGDWGSRGREPDAFHSRGPRPQVAGDWDSRAKPDAFLTNRQEREPDGFRDRKRYHSPDRAEPRLSRKDKIITAKKRREEEATRREPPRQQWPAEKQGPRPPFHQPEQFHRQNQNVDDRYQPREPEYHHTDPQWEPKRWEEPPRAERDREWDNGNDNRRDWESRPAPKVWDNPPAQQWPEQPREWDQPKPQWEDNYSRMPVEDHPPEWDYRQEPVDRRRSDSPPRDDRHRYRDSRPRRSGFDDRNIGPNWSRDPSGDRGVGHSVASSSRPRPMEETQRRDRPRSKNGRQERDWHEDRPNPSRDRPGPKKPDFGRANNYNDSKGQRPPPEFRPKAIARPTLSKEDRNEKYKQKMPFEPAPRKIPPKNPTEKHLPLRALINKDQSNRGQATSLIAKTVKGIPKGSNRYIPKSPLDAHIFKQLKVCIKSRIDVLLGEELSSDIGDVVKIYRAKFPINQDKSLLKQITERATKEHEEKTEKYRQEKLLQNEEIKKEAKNEIAVKKELEAETENSQEDVLNQAILEVPVNKTSDGGKQVKASDPKAAAPKKQPVPLAPPNMPKPKKGKPLTDKQVIQQMKLQRKWEYDHDDLYSLDDVVDKALEEELAELDKLFTDECSKPNDPQEDLICKRIATDSLNDFHKTIRLYITKRFLNIQTGLSIRVFAQGKLPKKEAIKQYLKKYRVESMTLKKSVKGTMFMVNLSRFEDFDKLCKKEKDVIDGVPVSFKALHLIGPPPKISRKRVLALRQQAIRNQVDPNIDPTEFEDTELYGPIGASEDTGAIEDKGAIEDTEAMEDNGDIEDEQDCEAGNFEDFEGKDAEFVETDDFAGDINIGNINEEDLEDF